MSAGYTVEDRKIDAIAKALVKALARIEATYLDPEMILESAEIWAHSAPVGVKNAVKALKDYYCEEGD